MDVRIDQATIRGSFDAGSGVHAFRGIPYAEPPVGARRWQRARPIEMRGQIDARQFGPVPAQPFQPLQRRISQALFFSPFAPQSEDCLHLNVWTPTLDDKADLPVMMWIPGGGFRGGSSASPLYDGAALAAKGVVLVSINYRVSRFGFLAHPWLSDESEERTSGNYGLSDQIAALIWIRRHIASFGGDAGNVTIFGQSAGSQSVVYLMCAPAAKGLFHRAIAQSGTPFSADGPAGLLGRCNLTLAEAEAEGVAVADRLGARTLDDLRAMSTDAICAACPPDSFTSSRPIVDGALIPSRVETCFSTGAFHDVPLMCGTTEAEGTIFDCQWSSERHRAFVAAHLPAQADAYAALYPFGTDDASRVGATAAYRDRMYDWPTLALAKAHARKATTPCHLYRFAIEPPCTPDDESDGTVRLGAFHGAELAFVFGTFHPSDWSWRDEHRSMSDLVQTSWVTFARTGRPVAGDGADWPRFELDAPQQTYIDESGLRVMSAGNPARAFWQAVAASAGGSTHDTA
jgi:para-nitrobenzyl esterase